MLSKNKIKLIKSLSQKKYRVKENIFLAEGEKITTEFLNSDFKLITLICTDRFFEQNEKLLPNNIELIIVPKEEIRKCSLQKSPQESILLCEIPIRTFNKELLSKDLTICLDNIQDPGNMGTILRIADWYGIRNICASDNTVDVFNPKVVQASMGSVLKVKVFYSKLEEILAYARKNNIQTFGTFLGGKNIYSENLPAKGIIVMGNEGKGISEELEKLLDHKLHIPAVRDNRQKNIDSLNVSVATAIICSEFRRNSLKDYSK